jgi:hypothetical protein
LLLLELLLYFFIRQGYSHDLLFWLFTDSVRETIRGHTFEYRNRPNEPCETVLGKERCFKDLVDLAVAAGLTVETQMVTAAGTTPGKPSTTIYARMCFDRVLADRARKEYSEEIQAQVLGNIAGHQPRCSDWHPPTSASKRSFEGSDTQTFEIKDTPVGPVSYQIITRSTFGIYQFLGRILAEEATENVRLRGRTNLSEDTRILSVLRDAGGPCFVSLAFEGHYYCVPDEGAEPTKRIFSLLAQLLALKTQTNDLAITPVVRVAP